MIQVVKFVRNFRCFKTGEEFAFRPGVNLFVGDQGSGKSSLLNALRTHNEVIARETGTGYIEVVTDVPTELFSFDFERDNPRVHDDRQSSGGRFMIGVAARFQSHGQFVNAVLRKLPGPATATVLMDEPDMALSIRSVRRLIERFNEGAAEGRQIVASAHNPLLIQAFPEVLSLEHRRWMTSEEFIALHTA